MRFANKPLKNDLIRSWMLLSLGTFGATLVIFGFLIEFNYSNQVSRISDDLKLKAPQIARRLSGELLLGENGAPQAVIADFKKYFDISVIEILPDGLSCSTSTGKSQSLCRNWNVGFVTFSIKIPSLSADSYLLIGTQRPGLFSGVNWSLFLVGLIPAFFMPLAGIWLQWRFLQKRLLTPLESLVRNLDTNSDFENWPIELVALRRQLDDLLSERDQAIAANQALRTQAILGDFVEGLLHDVQTQIVTGILVLDSSTEVPMRVRDKVRSLFNRISEIIRDHKKRIQSSAIPKMTEQERNQDNPASLGGVLQSLASEMNVVAQNYAVELVADIPRSSFTKFIPLSFSEFSRIGANLLNNAFQAGSNNRVHFCATIGQARCEIAIKDHGPGFAPSVLEAIARGESMTTKTTGTGVGIISAKALLNRVGGDLSILSSSSGTTVRIDLPLVDAPPWFADITKGSASQVICLDDDPNIAARLAHNLGKREIRVVQDEAEFLEVSRSIPDAVLLVDYNFGGTKDGIQFILDEGLEERGVLLSGRISFDETIRKTAQLHNIHLFPKECLNENAAYSTGNWG